MDEIVKAVLVEEQVSGRNGEIAKWRFAIAAASALFAILLFRFWQPIQALLFTWIGETLIFIETRLFW